MEFVFKCILASFGIGWSNYTILFLFEISPLWCKILHFYFILKSRFLFDLKNQVASFFIEFSKQGKLLVLLFITLLILLSCIIIITRV